MDDVPVAEGGAVAIPGADIFPWVREGRASGMEAADVQLRYIEQHATPLRLADLWDSAGQGCHRSILSQRPRPLPEAAAARPVQGRGGIACAVCSETERNQCPILGGRERHCRDP